MARQPQLTVNVNSQQFQNFAKQFNQFSGQIKQLNQSFAQVNAQLNKTNILVRGVTATMTGLLNITKSVGSEVWKITKNFISWSTIIGGITALLGMGGGLFGIERLAASILAKRRQVLGLGGDYGRTQASLIFSQGLLGSPGNTLQNIALGQHGAPDQMRALLTMGIPFGSQQDPDAIMDKIVEKLPDLLKRGGPGTELMTARAFGLDKLMDPMDLIRLSTEEGRKEYQMKRELVKQYEPLLKMTPKVQRAWAELEMQFQAAKAVLETAFGNTLADLAEPLKHLSFAFADLVRKFMDLPIVQKLIKQLAEWIDKLADKMKNLTDKDLEDFIDKITGWLPTMEDFKTYMEDFVNILKGVVKVLSIFFPKDQGAAVGTPTPGPNEPWQGVQKSTGGGLAPAGKELWGKASNFLRWSNDAQFRGATTVPGAMTMGEANVRAFNTFGLPTGGSNAPAGAGWQNTIGQGLGGFGGSGTGVPMPPPSMGSRSALPNPFSNWSGAATKMSPPSGGGGAFGSGATAVPGLNQPGVTPGPLSMNNWQSSRVANLVVRNVPGSNIFMTAAGMTA